MQSLSLSGGWIASCIDNYYGVRAARVEGEKKHRPTKSPLSCSSRAGFCFSPPRRSSRRLVPYSRPVTQLRARGLMTRNVQSLSSGRARFRFIKYNEALKKIVLAARVKSGGARADRIWIGSQAECICARVYTHWYGVFFKSLPRIYTRGFIEW